LRMNDSLMPPVPKSRLDACCAHTRTEKEGAGLIERGVRTENRENSGKAKKTDSGTGTNGPLTGI
jgi:hypothetical protein